MGVPKGCVTARVVLAAGQLLGLLLQPPLPPTTVSRTLGMEPGALGFTGCLTGLPAAGGRAAP